MAQVQNITFTKQTGQFRASLHTLQRFWKYDNKWDVLETVTFTKQTEQFSKKSTPLSNGMGGIAKARIQQAPKHRWLEYNYS